MVPTGSGVGRTALGREAKNSTEEPASGKDGLIALARLTETRLFEF